MFAQFLKENSEPKKGKHAMIVMYLVTSISFLTVILLRVVL